MDGRGVFVAPTIDFWRFDKPPASYEGPRQEELNWEVERFCALGEHRALEGVPGRPDPARVAADVEHWHAVLQDAHERTALPGSPSAEPELDQLVLDLRLSR